MSDQENNPEEFTRTGVCPECGAKDAEDCGDDCSTPMLPLNSVEWS